MKSNMWSIATDLWVSVLYSLLSNVAYFSVNFVRPMASKSLTELVLTLNFHPIGTIEWLL